MNRSVSTQLVSMRATRRALAATAAASLILLSGCGDDDEPASAATTVVTATEATTAAATTMPATTMPATTAPDTTSASNESDDAYCEIAQEIDDLPGAPNAEQLQTYADLAPDEIAETAASVLASFEGADGDVGALFEDPKFVEAIGELEAFEYERCGIGEPPSAAYEIDPDATRLDIVASEYQFDFEAPTEAGRYSFVMENAGEETHLMILIQLEDGAELDDVLASEGEEGVANEFESDLAPPGQEVIITEDLEPGRWVVLCPIPTDEDVPHFVEGMIHEFTIE